MISKEHNCIFIHIPRTGGTSIENMIWPMAERTEENLWMGFIRPFHNKYQTGGLQHLLASQVKYEVGSEVFDRFYKFSVVRNPWDKAVSQFRCMSAKINGLREFIGMKSDDSFETYLELVSRKTYVQWEQQSKFIFDNDGKQLVDKIIRFENFEDDVGAIMDRLNFPMQKILHLNKDSRDHYSRYYNDRTRSRVAELYSDDIERFDYKFERA